MIGTMKLTTLENTIMSESFKGKKVKGTEHYSNNIVGKIMASLSALKEDWYIHKYSNVTNKNVYQIRTGKKSVLVYCMSKNPNGKSNNSYMGKNVVERLEKESSLDWWYVWIKQSTVGKQQQYIFFANSAAIACMIEADEFGDDRNLYHQLKLTKINAWNGKEWEWNKPIKNEGLNVCIGKEVIEKNVVKTLAHCISKNMLEEE